MSNEAYETIRRTTTYSVEERRLPGSKQEQCYTLVISLGKIWTDETSTAADVDVADDQIRLQRPVASLKEATQKYEEFCVYHAQHDSKMLPHASLPQPPLIC